MIEGLDYFVHRVAFPNRANPALAAVNDDGSFDIYLNTLYDDERLARELQHELRHLEAEHFYVDLPIERIERQADGEALSRPFRPAAGQIACFMSPEALARCLSALAAQTHLDLDRLSWDRQLRELQRP